MSLLTELNGELLSEAGPSLLTETESAEDPNGAIALHGKAILQLFSSATLSSITVFDYLTLQAKAALQFFSSGILNTRDSLKAKATLLMTAKRGSPKMPGGLGAKMVIITNEFQPQIIVNQYLLVWFNGNPNQCRVALQIDDGNEFQPAFTWVNPNLTAKAIIRIEGADIPGDGRSHIIKISAWQEVAGETSPRATVSEYARTANIRPATQPAWCGATRVRQGQTVYSSPGVIKEQISDLSRIEWRHTGAVQIVAKLPMWTKIGNHFEWKQGVITLGYADHNESSFLAEKIGQSIGWGTGGVQDVLFGVASIHSGQFGPITWANAPLSIHEMGVFTAEEPQTPDQKSGSAQFLILDQIKDFIARQFFAENSGWFYPGSPGSGPVDMQRLDTVYTALNQILLRIKKITRQGGSVSLDNLGRFEARWNPARTLRTIHFGPSPGFTEGTQRGIGTLTDDQAKEL